MKGKSILYLIGILVMVLIANVLLGNTDNNVETVYAVNNDFPSLVYPFDHGLDWTISQGYNGTSHTTNDARSMGVNQYALDFARGIGNAQGLNVVATGSGTVWASVSEGNNNRHILLKHDNSNYYTLYAHMETVVVSEGEHVSQGQKIGTVGPGPTTGNDHIHLSLNKWIGSGKPSHDYIPYGTTNWQPTPFGFLDTEYFPADGSYNQWEGKVVQRGLPGVYLCEHAGLQGRCQRFTNTVLNFQSLEPNFCNDCATSVKVVGDYWAILWENGFAGGRVNYGLAGWNYTFGPAGNTGGHPSMVNNLDELGGPFNDKVSSIFVWQAPTNQPPKEGVYMCPDGWYQDGSSTNPLDCYNFPDAGSSCTAYDIGWWNNGATSFWVLGNYNVWVQSKSNPNKTATFTHSIAELWNPPAGYANFNDDIGTFHVERFGQASLPDNQGNMVTEWLFGKTAYAQGNCMAGSEARAYQASNLVISLNPAHSGQTNTFTFNVVNPGGSTLYMNEIFVQGTVPSGAVWKGWATTHNIGAGGTRTFMATAPMWGSEQGVWSIDKIVYKDTAGNFHDLLANGYVQSRKFYVADRKTFVRAPNYPTVFYVENNLAYPIADPVTYSLLGGIHGSAVRINQSVINTLRRGNTITLSRFNGTFVKGSTQPTIFLIENGIAKPIASPPVFFLLGGNWSSYVTISQNVTDQMPKGSRITLARFNGTFVKGSSATIYIISSGQKRPIPNWPTYLCLGGINNGWKNLPDNILNQITRGAVIWCP